VTCRDCDALSVAMSNLAVDTAVPGRASAVARSVPSYPLIAIHRSPNRTCLPSGLPLRLLLRSGSAGYLWSAPVARRAPGGAGQVFWRLNQLRIWLPAP
jgi:hypothetical protein